MKTLGIVGGLGPESTIEYYRRILSRYDEQRPGAAPSIVINSIDVNRGLRMLGENRLDDLTAYLTQAVLTLARAGADFGLISANTPHIVFDEVQRQSPIPLISIVEAASAHAKANGLFRLALLGTGFTMQSDFYARVFSRDELLIVVPDESEQSYIHEKYIGELLRGVVLAATKNRLTEIIESMRDRDKIDGVVLGGTELSLIFREPTVSGIPVLDTTQIQVEAAVRELLRD